LTAGGVKVPVISLAFIANNRENSKRLLKWSEYNVHFYILSLPFLNNTGKCDRAGLE